MKIITIRLEDSVHKDVKRMLVEEEDTFQNYINTLIDSDMKKRKIKTNK